MTGLDTSRLISILSNPPEVPYPVILPDFFVDHFILFSSFEEFIESLENLAKQGGGNLLRNEQFIRRGGNCVNTAAALVRLGIQAKMIVTTDEYGESLLRALAPPGLDLDHIHTNGRLSSTVSIETEFNGRKVNLMVSDSGSASSFTFQELTPSDLQVIRDSGLIALVNLNHNKNGASLASALFTMAKETTDAITFMDIGDPSNNPTLLPPLVTDVLSAGIVDVLSLNENEVAWLASTIRDNDNLRLEIIKKPEKWIEAAKLVSKETDVRIILHTPRFASNISGDDVVTIPSFNIEPKVMCGSGDAFNAGLIYGLLQKLPIEDQLLLANAVAALYITSPDSIPPTKASTLKYLNSNPLVFSNGKKLLMD